MSFGSRALLADATWYGTLAAARDLGARGVAVTLASDSWVAPAAWSRCVALHEPVSCPRRRMLQNCPSTERIYTVDGFTGETGEFCTSPACMKMLQCPRGSDPGIIFERAEMDSAIDQGLRRLFRASGFGGVFDAEFLECGGCRFSRYVKASSGFRLRRIGSK
jgi:hypothetical protein